MRMKHSALLLTAGFLLMPTLLWSQLPGQGGNWGPPGGGAFPRGAGTGEPGSGGPGGGRSRMFGDPEQLFARYSKDGNTLRKEDLPPQVQMGIDMFGAQLGLTGNQWTRDDLRQATERVRTTMGGMSGAGGTAFGRSGMPGMGGAGGPGMGGPSDSSRGDRGDRGDRDRRLDEAFKRMDQNEDGVLQFHEMTETLQSERDKHDANHDGTVDLNEFREYVNGRFSGARSGDNSRPSPRGGPDDQAPVNEEERRRPTLLRAGNLPREFPYASLDTNVDGQVGLYEWKYAGRRINDFLPMDLNNDGYMTVDEYFRWKKQGDEQAMKDGSASGDFARGPGRGMPNMMAFNPGMMTGRGMAGGGIAGGGMPGRGFGMSGMMPGMQAPGGNWGSGMPSRFGMQGMTPGMPTTMNWGSGMSPRGMDMSGGGAGRERGFGMSGGMSPGNWAGGGSGMPMVPGGNTSFRMGDRGSFTPGSTGSFTMPGGGAPGMGMQGGGPMQFRMPGMGGERGPRGSDERGPGQFRDRGERGERGQGGPDERGPGGRRERPGGEYGGERPSRKDRN